MKILKDTKGRISLLELVIIILLIFEGAYFLTKGFGWYAKNATTGDDKLLVNTAESTAKVNSLNGTNCPVSDCLHGDSCTHKRGEYYVGYFDSKTHHIVGYAPKGYNQNNEMYIGDEVYHGAPGTMVIEIRCKDGEVKLAWVKGS
ncbi:MAG: hypothetical protein IKD94_00155 [Erysipelotrichaceae bacterium]|nr:hypothetical protein [Erysipelotrichaceae bacterium]